MKKLALFLVLSMLITSLSIPSIAEGTSDVILESESGFYYIEAEGNRPRLSAYSKDKFFQADGEWFKDLNNNGELDPYEDWRLPTEERAQDLLSQMTINEKAGILGFGGVAGNNGITVSAISEDLSEGTGDTTSIITPDHPSMTASAEEEFVTSGVTTYPSMRYQIQVMGMKTMIGAMTGLPKDQLDVANALQAIAEEAHLGIPMVISGDRTYNTWGGMIDMPHYALGVARDPELLYNLCSEYAKEAVAIGYQQVFHGYGNEIGSFYGDDPEYIALMASTETRAYEDNNYGSHSKHFIARGGRNSYANARSEADLIDSWLIGWKAVVDAGTEWIMCNNAVARTPGLIGIMDKTTYDLLRNDLGYDGLVCLDWLMAPSSIMSQTGITADGIDISTLTLGERYVLMLNVGIDVFSCGYEVHGGDYSSTEAMFYYLPDLIIEEIEAGRYTEEALDVHVLRVLRNKFHLGIFENPYRDWGEALELIGSDAYRAEQFVPMTNEDINKARRAEVTAMEEEVMVKSTIVLKNDDVLPLKADQKVFVDSTAATSKDALTEAIAAKAAVVGSMEEADVIVIETASFNDAYELLAEDANDSGKPVVLIFEGSNSSEPALRQFLDCDALIMQTYNNTPDHGSSFGFYYRYVTPTITADILFGEKEATGKTLFELGYSDEAKALSWGELQDDIGVSDEVRLYMAMLAKINPEINMPNNLGDVIVTEGFGIELSKPADIQLSLLTLPRSVETVTTESNGSASTQTSVVNLSPTAGEAFTIHFVAWNVGEGDGLRTVQILDNGTVINDKVIGVAAGQFRVISVDLVLEAGEHLIDVGGMTATVTVN